MRSPLLSPVVVAVGGIFALAFLTSALITASMRETSGIENRWDHTSAVERTTKLDALKQQFEQTPGKEVPTNIIAGSGPEAGTGGLGQGSFGGGDFADYNGDGVPETGDYNHDGVPNTQDHDGDGIPNDVEIAGKGSINGGDGGGQIEVTVATDPSNPDTDGDGVDDYTEILNGTDPTKADEGGLTIINYGPVSPAKTDFLAILDFSKLVSIGGSNYQVAQKVMVGGTVTFKIELVVANFGSTKQIRLQDRMSRGLSYVAGSSNLSQNGNFPEPLDDAWLGGTGFTVTPGLHKYVIIFQAQATTPGYEDNTAIVSESSDLANTQTARAFVSVKENPADADNPKPQVNLDRFYKQVRVPNGDWDEYVEAPAGGRVEFRVVAEINNTLAHTYRATIIDAIPQGITPLAGQARVYTDNSPQGVPLPDNWSTSGFSFDVSPGLKRIEIVFPATLDIDSTISENTASLQLSNDGPIPINKKDSAIVVTK